MLINILDGCVFILSNTCVALSPPVFERVILNKLMQLDFISTYFIRNRVKEFED